MAGQEGRKDGSTRSPEALKHELIDELNRSDLSIPTGLRQVGDLPNGVKDISEAFRNGRSWKTIHASARCPKSVCVSNGKYWFVADSNNDSWNVVDLSDAEFSSSMTKEYESTLRPSLEMARFFCAMPAADFFSLPCVRVKDRFTHPENPDLVCVRYECSEPYDKIPAIGVTVIYLRGEVRFSKSRNMAIDSFDAERGDGSRVALVTGGWTSHANKPCSVPLSFSVTTTVQGKEVSNVKYTNSVSFEPVPRIEFSLAAFGIPEPEWLHKSFWYQSWVHWTIATLGLFIGAGIVRRYRQ